VEELLGAYALDAVPEEERRLVETHLAVCDSCRAEVEGHRAVAALLASAGAPAPQGLWDRIARALGPVTPLGLEAAPERRRTGRRGLLVGVAASVAAILAIAALGVKVIEQDRVLDRLVATSQERGLAEAANAALVDPRATRVTLASEDRRVFVEAVLLPNGSGYIVQDNLPPVPVNRTYQLWALDEGDPISLGVLGSDPNVAAFSAQPGVSQLAITEERAGGVASPRNKPLVLGQVQPA
jgi:hypothetical protein